MQNADRGRKLYKTELIVIEGILIDENQSEAKDIFLILLLC